jgi:hypothetical protein
VAPEEDGDYLPLDPEGPFAFLEAADRDGLVALLRSWSALPDAADREWAMRRLAWLGDPASAKQIVAFVRSAPVADDGGSPMAWLSRTGGPIVEAYLRGVVADDAAEPARRVHALADLAVLYGATEAEVSALELFDGPESTAKALRALVLDRRPGAAIEAARAAVEDPGERSVPTETGERALAGDPAARRDLWESFRVGRYRWICYENDWNALTLGYDPVTYPQLLTELETNCCRGGHVARMFERLMGADTLSYQPEGMDATPRRRAATWLALYGGRFVKSRLAGDGTPDEGWTSAAE